MAAYPLISATEIHSKTPTIRIPSLKRRKSLEIGTAVRLRFVAPSSNGYEELWVVITGRSIARYEGSIYKSNASYYNAALNNDKAIEFYPRHIFKYTRV